MYSLSTKYARDIYIPELQTILQHGEEVEVRGRYTKELLNFATEIYQPQHHCILIPSRRWNPWIAMSEALWILAGRNDVVALKPYNSHISDYSDDGVSLYGAYGARIYDQIDNVIERLQKDPSDRRAVLQIWGYNQEFVNSRGDWIWRYDLTFDTKDPPCNNLVYFKLRQNKLHMTVINRSNDIHWGLFAVNIPTFGILQEYIAARLGVELGTQTHFSNSLHVYTDEPQAVAITERMLADKEELPVYPEHELFLKSDDYPGGICHYDFAEVCGAILDNHWHPLGTKFHAFALDFLKQYREHNWHPEDIIHANEHQDWILAGQLFVDQVWK